jgi:hypothetical protein
MMTDFLDLNASPSGQTFEMRKNLVAQFEDQLIEAEIHFSFDFIVEELFSKDEKCMHRCIVV